MLVILAGTAHAQTGLPEPGILPDSAFYGLKKAFEAVGGAFTFGNEARVERGLKLSEKRLAEAKAMAEKGRPDIVNSLSLEYEKHLGYANRIAGLAKEANERERLTELVSLATSQHLGILDDVQAKVPDIAKNTIAAAREKSIKGNQEALKALARENPEKAAQIAIDAAESRVSEAMEAANSRKYEEAIASSAEYEKYARFGEEISAIAQQMGKDSSKAEELIEKATSHHMTVLEDVRAKVPEEAKPYISMVIEQTQEGRESAVGSRILPRR